MNVAFISDPHLIAPDDPHKRREQRQRFGEAWPSFRRMINRLNEVQVDHVIILGDLVDYYSDANRDFALDILADLEVPWELTPGNHDFEVHPRSEEEAPTDRDEDWARAGWEEAGITLSNRVLDIGDTRILLMESAHSEVPEGTGEWLDSNLDTDRYCIIATHVPLDTPEVVDSITSKDPNRTLDKYVQRGSPDLFKHHVKGRVEAVFSGHLHFPADASMDGTKQHILPPCIHVRPPYPQQGSAFLLRTDEPTTLRQLRTKSDID